jgi:hypothetical protein
MSCLSELPLLMCLDAPKDVLGASVILICLEVIGMGARAPSRTSIFVGLALIVARE